ncbi:hypothetical protein TWF281_008519 [Arthrobotrys megalospora]
MSNYVSALTKTYACVTMVDVAEGDCYVIDLFLGGTLEDPRFWNRFVIDVGGSFASPASRVETILEAICGASFSDLDPWKDVSVLGPNQGANVPPLCGITITHSDDDHWGNAQKVITALRKLQPNITPRHNLVNTAIPIALSPQKDWAKDMWGTMGVGEPWIYGVSYTDIQNGQKAWGLKCHFRSLFTGVENFDFTKTFFDLGALAKQAGYEIQYRFNRVDAEIIQNLRKDLWWNDALPVANMDVRGFHTRHTEWRTDSHTIVSTIDDLSETYFEERSCLQLDYLIEARIVPLMNPPSRTVTGNTWFEPIYGQWLRTICKVVIPNPFFNQIPKNYLYRTPMSINRLRGLTGYTQFGNSTDYRVTEDMNFNTLDMEQIRAASEAGDAFARMYTQSIFTGDPGGSNYQLLPSALQVQPIYTGWSDRPYYMRFFEPGASGFSAGGPWGRSIYGCAGSDYVRDFAHLVLQFYLSYRGDETIRHEENGVVTYSKERTPRSKPQNWAHYANRASIITHFICDDDYGSNQNPQSFILTSEDPDPSRRPGTFEMLFTGDAFEWDKFEKEYYDEQKMAKGRGPLQFFPDLPMMPPDGNLVNWLWRQNRLRPTRVGVLKVPHHGSSDTTGATFFRTVTASVYLISAGTKHGHPRAETLETILKAIVQEDGSAEPPENFVSNQTGVGHNNNTRSIKQRLRPRLIFFSNQCINQTILDMGPNDALPGKSYVPFYQYLRYLCPFVGNDSLATQLQRRANVRFFHQKVKDSKVRLRFGSDHVRPDEVRAEWDKEAWEEFRFDGLLGMHLSDPAQDIADPVAYPRPGNIPDWEVPL